MPKSLPSGLIVRELKQDDIPSLAELFISAPDDGQLYQVPDFYENTEGAFRIYVRWLRSLILDRTVLCRIAVIPVDHERDKIVGFSSWLRREPDPVNPEKVRLRLWRKLTLIDAINTQLMRCETLYNTFYSKIHPLNALKGIPERAKALSHMRKRNPSPASSIPCYELNGMAVHSDFQGFGIGTLLVRWGLNKAEADGVPVFTGGEERGVLFYTNALGFQRIPETEYWLDKDAREITREEVERGNTTWKTSIGGVSGSDVVWYPESMRVKI